MKKWIKFKKLKKLKDLKKDRNGNIFAIASILFIIPIILMAIMISTLSIDASNINQKSITSNSFNYEIEDYKRNIPVLGYYILDNLSTEIVNSKIAIDDSREEIKNRLQRKLDDKSIQYYKNNNIQIKSNVLYVNNNEDPFYITIKTNIQANLDDLAYEGVIESNISIINLKDPLPPIFCGNDSTFAYYGISKYDYGNSLFNYLHIKSQSNPEAYINATSPAIIKKCHYDPYTQHGDGITMKNCIDNGYYHESADGSCYFCRLEGKGGCYHYGLETFIITNKTVDNATIRSTSASDHVIFDYSYPGNSIIIYSYNGLNDIIILDDGHKSKYGLI